MKILVTGATGFLGRHLLTQLIERKHGTAVLTRSVDRHQDLLKSVPEVFQWNPELEPAPARAFQGVDCIIHLAGENIAGHRWSRSQKQRIFDSRVLSTQNLLRGLAQAGENQVKRFLCASAIGFYGDRDDEVLDESSGAGEGFLSRVCQAWENEAGAEARLPVVLLRSGMVLGRDGGALPKMLPAFRFGLGGALGSGEQWMSWIHVRDWVEACIFLLERSDTGPFNLCSPQSVLNSEFTRILAARFGKKPFLRISEVILKFGLGELSELLLTSQRVTPKRLLESGFEFAFPDLGKALSEMTR